MRIISYIFWLIGEIAKSSIATTKLIWQSELKISPVMDFVKTKQKNDVKRVVFANSITLTPGTITVSVENDKLLVHALTQAAFDDLSSGAMDGRICSI